MSASFTIYNAAKLEVEAGKSSHNHFGWLDLSITETDGTTHDITIHFDMTEGFAMATRRYFTLTQAQDHWEHTRAGTSLLVETRAIIRCMIDLAHARGLMKDGKAVS